MTVPNETGLLGYLQDYKMKHTVIAASIALLSVTAHAQLSQNNGCVTGATSCTGSNQNSGDTTTTTNNGDTHDTASQIGGASNSISSGNSTNFDNRAQTTQNTTGTISGGNTSSSATGNLSSNDNRSSVGNTSATTGASTSSSNSGGNSLATGPSTSSVGNTSATGGAGGRGGQGGAGGSSIQGQGQQQGQSATLTGGNTTSGATARSGNSTSGSVAAGGNQHQTATGGTSGASANGAGQRTVSSLVGGSQSVGGTTIGGSTYTDNSRTIFIPPVVPSTPPSVVGVGQVIQTTLACGPLQTVVKEPIVGTYFGMFSNEQIEQGHNDFLAPVRDQNGTQINYRQEVLPNGDIRLFGTQPVIFATVVVIAGARNIAIGGGAGSGSWGQAGGGASASMSQMVTSVQLHDCEVGTLHQTVAVLPEVKHISE